MIYRVSVFLICIVFSEALSSCELRKNGVKIGVKLNSSESTTQTPKFDNQHDGNSQYRLDDMILTKEQMDYLFLSQTRRNALKDPSFKWPNNTVPVYINNDFDPEEREMIWDALKKMSEVSCIKFTNASSTAQAFPHVHIADGPGCISDVGFNGGMNRMSLNRTGCLDVGRISHEFLHTLGFFHMHTTVGRDKFVDIAWENIDPHYCVNFDSYETETTLLGTDYDYESVMHYGPTAFTINGNATIMPKKLTRNAIMMGQRTHLSQGDIKRLNKLYECEH